MTALRSVTFISTVRTPAEDFGKFVRPVAFDMDGVLCSAYPHRIYAWEDMSQRDREAHMERVRRHCIEAEFVFRPDHAETNPIVIITGRREQFRLETTEWLHKYGFHPFTLFMMPDHYDHSWPAIASFKVETCLKHGIRTYFEDDDEVMEAVAILPYHVLSITLEE